jgi:tRNA modification GTPase
MPGRHDTIVAIATPTGAGGIGIVRLSGASARSIAEAICGRRLKPRCAELVKFRDQHRQLIDQGIALYFVGPHSFTGEDVVELQAHGAPVVLQQLVKAAVDLGARPARAGEFSERAYLNGKIDLAQAEAIADLIASQSAVQARAALRSLNGEFSQRVKNLQAALIHARLGIEAAIDFAEEEIDFLSAGHLRGELADLTANVNAVLQATRRGQHLRDGLHAVLIGRPNAGKSSLLNALAGTDRAIVTALPGTTRDVLREPVLVDGMVITLVDTAGLRASTDLIEQAGIERARSELERADLALIVLDPAEPEALEALVAEAPAAAMRLIVHSKIDLSPSAALAPSGDGEVHIGVSAKTGAGLDQLRLLLAQFAGRGDGGDGSFSARARHVAALEQVSTHVALAESRLLIERAGELAAEELKLAQQALSELTGEYLADDLLGAIFGTFCIGK